jgi:methylenetetrahydrofolate dehydrogenase (NADP+) / methenyltetrahydrofolate cyclohydrolase
MIIDGKKVSNEIKQAVKLEVEKLVNEFQIVPKLVVVLVGDIEASKIYVRNKERACIEAGMITQTIRKSANLSEDELLDIIRELNQDKSVHGILVQLPLPKHMNESKVIDTIDPRKDVDGFHTLNKGTMLLANKGLLPATPKGILTLLKSYQIPIAGKKAVIVGRSNIVGKPVSIMLLNENATVTITNSYTKDLKFETLQADILVVATGKANLITKDMVKEGAVVIDVGMNRLEGKLCGDVDYDAVATVASFITPVPGGVGPMTIASLLQNTLLAYQQQINQN